MKYAIIADIHANLPALHTVLRDADGQGCTHTACLGDIVGYYSRPKQCLDIIRDLNIPVVKGNHDEYCTMDNMEGFNAHAVDVFQWTRQQLSEDDRKWLASLPLTLVVDKPGLFKRKPAFQLVHATLDGPHRWGYVFDKLGAAASFCYQETQVCFFGHTHIPLMFTRDSVVRGGTYSKFKIESGKKYFINPGSVGQPRDGDPRASYLTYDLDSQTIELRRLEYTPDEPPSFGGSAPVPGGKAPTGPTGPTGPLVAREDYGQN